MGLALSNQVRSILSRPEISKVSFTLGGVQLGPSSFRLVKEAIRNNRIEVVFDPALPAGVAVYGYTENKLRLGFRASGITADSEALIIHECVHMACDLSTISVKVELDEAAAYTAQCMYYFYRNEQQLNQPGVRPTFGDPILREAWKVATLARTQKVLSSTDIKDLLAAISRHRLYKYTHSTTKHYDG